MKKIFLTGFFILIVLLSGCTKGEKTDTGDKDPFIGGTEGLLISFEEDSPPEEVYDGGDFPFEVVVKIENQGEAMVKKEDALVTISGIFSSQFNKTEEGFKRRPADDIEANRKDADGASVKSNPVFFEFQGFNHMGQLAGSTQFTFRADVCYKYQTKA